MKIVKSIFKFYRFSLILICTIRIELIYSQLEFSNWCYGNQLGLVFRGDSVYNIDSSKMDMHEGCATVSDRKGNLLFYAGGSLIYNKEHNKMEGINNELIKGHWSSCQGAIIVPKPKSNYIYYLFTVDGLSYSVNPNQLPGPPGRGAYLTEIDMRLDGGLGAVTSLKNFQLLKKGDEKLTCIIHSNGKHIWVLIAEGTGENSKIHSYLVSENGVDTLSVVSDIGYHVDKSMTSSGSDLGCMKVSPDGKTVAIGYFFSHAIVLADFDNTTGKLSNPRHIDTKTFRPYGIEFSPNSQFLYVGMSNYTGNRGGIFQYNLKAGSLFDIIKSSYYIPDPIPKPGYYGAESGSFQRAINGKIYFVYYLWDSASVINFPDSLGVKCMVKFNSVPSKGKKRTKFGLPQWIYHSKQYDFTYNYNLSNCNFKVNFNLNDTSFLVGKSWNFGDSLSGVENKSNETNPTHIYNNPGKYNVSLILEKKNGEFDTIRNTIIIEDSRNTVNLPDTLIFCRETLNLGKCLENVKYFWNTGDTICIIKVENPGIYKITYLDSNRCIYKDSTVVLSPTIPKLQEDTSICIYDSIFLFDRSGNQFKSYNWNTKDSGKLLKASVGTYILYVKDKFNCLTTDTVEINKSSNIDLNIGTDTSICQGDSLVLIVNSFSGKLEWQDGSEKTNYIVKTSGIYKLTIKDSTCIYSDSIKVNLYPYPISELPDTLFHCGLFTQILQATIGDYKYFWNTGSQNQNIEINKLGKYWVEIDNKGCIIKDSVVVVAREEGEIFIPNAITTNRDNLNDLFPSPWPGNTFNIEIYNRWGELLYQGEKAWDGTYKDQIVQEGVYTYLLTYLDCKGRRKHLRGTVTILY